MSDLEEPKVSQHFRLPDERCAVTHKFSVGGHEGYVTVGFYRDPCADGKACIGEGHTKIGEVFFTMAKQGSTVSGLLGCLGISVSIALQRGVPIEVFYDKFIGQRFEPMGPSSNVDIGHSQSIIDYVFRWMRHRFNPELERAEDE